MQLKHCQLFLLLGTTVNDVRTTIKQLRNQFKVMRNATEEALEKARIGMKEVASALMSIPAAKKKSHQHLKLFLRESNKAFFKSESIPELFGLVDLHWSYLEYHLLEYLIQEFVHKCLQSQMELYKHHLYRFMENTPLTLFWEADEDKEIPHIKPEFATMVTEHNWPPTVTLMDVERFRRAFVSEYCLHECAMMLQAARPGSVHITWFIPQSIMHYLMEEIQSSRAEFFQESGIIQLELDGQCIYTAESTTQVHVLLLC